MSTAEQFPKRAIWIAVLFAATFLFSWRFACATPLAALAAVAVLTMSRNQALFLVIAAFALNQAIGFTLLNYPTDPSTLGWGAAIGVGALVAVACAYIGAQAARAHGAVMATIIAYVGATIGYQLVMWAAYFVLPGMFQWAVLIEVVQINTLAVLALMGVFALARMTGVAALEKA